MYAYEDELNHLIFFQSKFINQKNLEKKKIFLIYIR